MNAYERLSKRLADHVYKRGAHKGDAPLESRRKSHIRVRRINDTMVAVRMYETDILTAHSSGNITINLGRWLTSTTKQWLNYALRLTRIDLRITSKRVQSLSQLVIRTPYGYYRHYNGIEFDPHGRLLSKPLPFEARRINKLAVAEFMQGMEDSGFKDMYPVLYATSSPEDYSRSHYYLDKVLTDPDNAPTWATAIAQCKYDWDWRDNAKACWARMMKQAKSNMYINIKTEVTVIPL